MDLDEEGLMNTAPELENSDTVERQDKAEVEIEDKATSEETNGGGTTTTSSNFIQDLNMVLILAFLSLSADEQLDLEEIKQTTATTHEYTDSKGKPSVSTSQFRRRHLNIDGFRHPERQFSRSHSKIQDCRHGRRV